ERLCRGCRHDLRGHFEEELPGQRLEVCCQGHLRVDQDAQGQWLTDPDRALIAMTPTAGLGFKPQHFSEALASPAVGLWFEVHAENYMIDGGPRLAMLEQLRRERPLSLHGVGLSLGSPHAPDAEHLSALKRLVDRFEPALV